jgi:hypothetical protein
MRDSGDNTECPETAEENKKERRMRTPPFLWERSFIFS